MRLPGNVCSPVLVLSAERHHSTPDRRCPLSELQMLWTLIHQSLLCRWSAVNTPYTHKSKRWPGFQYQRTGNNTGTWSGHGINSVRVTDPISTHRPEGSLGAVKWKKESTDSCYLRLPFALKRINKNSQTLSYSSITLAVGRGCCGWEQGNDETWSVHLCVLSFYFLFYICI